MRTNGGKNMHEIAQRSQVRRFLWARAVAIVVLNKEAIRKMVKVASVILFDWVLVCEFS